MQSTRQARAVPAIIRTHGLITGAIPPRHTQPTADATLPATSARPAIAATSPAWPAAPAAAPKNPGRVIASAAQQAARAGLAPDRPAHGLHALLEQAAASLQRMAWESRQNTNDA